MKLKLSLVLFLLCANVHAQAPTVRSIADNDIDALAAAIQQANLSTLPTTIQLAPRGHYVRRGSLPPILSNITIEGRGAEIDGWETEARFSVSPGATLTLRQVALSRYSSGAMFGGQAMIRNRGTFIGEQMTIRSSAVGGYWRLGGWGLIHNEGFMRFTNSSLVDNVVGFGMTLLWNHPGAKLEIYNSTLANNRSAYIGSSSSYVLTNANIDPAAARIANSIIFHTAAEVCNGPVQSFGGNLVNKTGCLSQVPGAFQSPNDRLITDAGFGSFATHGGLVATLALNGNSPAIDNGLAEYCPAADARGALRSGANAGPGCDSGAYEFGGSSTRGDIAEGGLNGAFLSQTSDGHYITVQRINERDALIIWSTFDTEGNNLWLYAVGQVDGTTIRATAARNIGGIFVADGEPTGHSVDIWGEVELRLVSCNAGVFSYSTQDPAFGTGEFPIRRLAYVNELGCTE